MSPCTCVHNVPIGEQCPGCDFNRTTIHVGGVSEYVGEIVADETAALRERVRVLEDAVKRAVAWVHDPDEDPVQRFERIAEEFRRDTGFLRPGKSEPPGYAMDEVERQAAWEKWVNDRSRRVLADLREATK